MALDAGLDAQTRIRGKSLVNWLTEMYSRGENFAKCLRLLVDRGAVLNDPVVAPVLMNDPDSLKAAIQADPALLQHRTTMISAFTALFHTVNSSGNHAAPIMELLLQAGARTDVVVRGSTWGKGFEWETTVFDVTPISYAQLGLLPQMHRREVDIYNNIRLTSLFSLSGHLVLHPEGNHRPCNISYNFAYTAPAQTHDLPVCAENRSENSRNWY